MSEWELDESVGLGGQTPARKLRSFSVEHEIPVRPRAWIEHAGRRIL